MKFPQFAMANQEQAVAEVRFLTGTTFRLRKTHSFERARLQPCRKCLKRITGL